MQKDCLWHAMVKQDLSKSLDSTEAFRLRVNLCLSGEPAKWYRDWRTRGLVESVKDAVLMSFQALQEKVTEQDLKRAQLRTLTEREG